MKQLSHAMPACGTNHSPSDRHCKNTLYRKCQKKSELRLQHGCFSVWAPSQVHTPRFFVISSPSADLPILVGDLKPVQMLATRIQAVSILSIRTCCLQPRERVGPFVVAAPSRGFVVAKHVPWVVHLGNARTQAPESCIHNCPALTSTLQAQQATAASQSKMYLAPPRTSCWHQASYQP